MPPSSSLDIFCDFLSASIHLVLYVRRVYPREIFERRRCLDVTTFKARHPELCEYIALVVDGARQLLMRGEADALVISIRDARHTLLERIRFDLRLSGELPEDAPALATRLRGFLLKLHVADSLLPGLPASEHLSFTAELHTVAARSQQPLPVSLLEAWAEETVSPHCDEAMDTGSAVSRGSQRSPSVVPLKSMCFEGLTLALSVLSAPAASELQHAAPTGSASG